MTTSQLDPVTESRIRLAARELAPIVAKVLETIRTHYPDPSNTDPEYLERRSTAAALSRLSEELLALAEAAAEPGSVSERLQVLEREVSYARANAETFRQAVDVWRARALRAESRLPLPR